MCRTIGPEPAVTYHIIRGRRRPIGGANVRPRRMLTALLPCPLAGRANVSPSIVSSVRWGDIGHCRSYIARYEGGGLCAIQDQQEDRKVSGQSEQRPKLLAVPLLPAAKIMPAGRRRHQPDRLVQLLCKEDVTPAQLHSNI